MKKQLKFTNKQTAIGLAVAANVTALLLVVSLIPRSATGGFDLDGLNQQVQKQGEELDNHEARITNTENDVKDIQQNTGTAPSTNRQTVPSVSTPAATPSTASPSPAPAPAPAERTFVYLGHPTQVDRDHCMIKKQWSDGIIEENIVDRFNRTGSSNFDLCP